MKFDNAKYGEAIERLRKATEDVDQADAILRDLECRPLAQIHTGIAGYQPQIIHTRRIIQKHGDALESAICEDCGVLFTDHGEQCNPSSEVTQR